MNTVETILPRILAVVQLFVSLVMFGIIIYIAAIFLNGRAVPPSVWAFPMIILAIVLWLATTGDYVVNLRALLPA